MAKSKFDFSGYATKVDLKCSDGRIIRKDAFKHNDNQTVPLVWQHIHNDPSNVLGHALLENRDDGVYAYCTFNGTEKGQHAKELVVHGDVNALSIYANELKQKGNDVLHGDIKEVSLVLAGANPGALIDNLSIQHADGSYETDDSEAIIYTGEPLSLTETELGHADNNNAGTGSGEDNETMSQIFDSLNAKQKEVVYAMISHALETSQGEGDDVTGMMTNVDEMMQNADQMMGGNMPEKAKEAMAKAKEELAKAKGMLGETKKVEHAATTENDQKNSGQSTTNDKDKGTIEHSDTENKDKENIEHSNGGGNNIMKQNIFDKETKKDTLSHADVTAIIGDAKRYGSLRDSALAHGVTNIDYLFPDATNIDGTPQFITRDMGWVKKVMSSIHHTPFSRIKSILADLTEADARAKGYIKGKLKAEEVFALLKRTTTPTTIYKKQKLDRDDVVDITDFDVVSWLKTEMRMMLDEEIARAILIGDGRLAASDDKINETNVRPIWKDDDLYSVKTSFDVTAAMTDDEKAKAFIKSAIKTRKNYKGSGNPTLFITEDMLTNCLLLEDTTGRVIYDSVAKLATTLRVSEIITVPVMESQTRTVDANTMTLHGIIVNLDDYNVGADKGGAVNLFDDFDIDYNAQKYLIETRASGALTKPYSAIVIESKPAAV
jgi:HK97 family phage prohead protease